METEYKFTDFRKVISNSEIILAKLDAESEFTKLSWFQKLACKIFRITPEIKKLYSITCFVNGQTPFIGAVIRCSDNQDYYVMEMKQGLSKTNASSPDSCHITIQNVRPQHFQYTIGEFKIMYSAYKER